jgi:hypothetical protein
MTGNNEHPDTWSVCPECLQRIPAYKIKEENSVILEKTCPEHGVFRVKIWEGKPEYAAWNKVKLPSKPQYIATGTSKGCPYDCGLCPEHRQHTCCVLLEITERCNQSCPVCFAESSISPDKDPSIKEIESWYDRLMSYGGPFNIQLSGGEPTVREDLPEIINLGISKGFSYIQLNTNGRRLGTEDGYAAKLKDAGLSCVFLQFDGMNNSIQRYLRGADLMDIKLKAVEECKKAGLGIVLVPTLVPGVNSGNIGEIISFALDNMPAVRGVHIQPISYFGRFPEEPALRITIPEVLNEIEKQTSGLMRIEDFKPPGGENSYCSFHCNFLRMPDGRLKPLADPQTDGCCSKPVAAAAGAVNKRNFVARQWSPSSISAGKILKAADSSCGCSAAGINTDSIDHFLENVKTKTICISGMAFQDAWTLEIDRLRDCLVHVLSRDGRLIPFCAYNLTSRSGQSLYRKAEHNRE